MSHGSTAMALLTVLIVGTGFGVACRREHPAIARNTTATAVAAAAATAQAQATSTPVPQAAEPQAGGGSGRIAAGSLGVAATGISAGIQLWSRPGGIMAGGSTMTGTLQDGVEVEILAKETFLGQTYYQVRSREAGREGWVDGRFVELD